MGILGIVGFFAWGKLKNKFLKKGSNDIVIPPELKPLAEKPDPEKIKKEFKDETPQESVKHVHDLFAKLFPPK